MYQIRNLVNGKQYIGSAKSLAGRFAVHRNGLRNSKHHSLPLQRAWDLYGEEAFAFTPLLICSAENCVLYEQILLDALRPAYNVSRIAGSVLGTCRSDASRQRMSEAQLRSRHFLGRKHTPETLALMSAAKRGNTATKGKRRSPEAVAKTAAAHTGMKRSAETRARISAARRASVARKKGILE